MKTELAMENRRLGILVHHASVFALIIYIYSIIGRNIPLWSAGVGLVLIAVAVISFVQVYVRRQLWKFTWAKAKSLDERELQVTQDSFRQSYNVLIAVFLAATIVTFIVENSYWSTEALLEKRSFNAVPLLLALVYFSKTLPASIIAWKEKDIVRE